MDHIIEIIMDYMQQDVEELRKEWTSGKEARLSDCHSYDTVKAYCAAIRELNKVDGRYPGITPTTLVEGGEN
jgi:hypothetical protein